MSRNDPLFLFLAELGARELRLDLGFLMEAAKGRREVWEGVAKRVAELSNGRVPVNYWPAVKSGDGFLHHAGRRKKNPDLKAYEVLPEMGYASPKAYCEAKGIPHQLFSYWANGQRYAPKDAVEEFEKESKGKVKLADWPLVRDRMTGQRWHYGEEMPVGMTAAEAMRDNAA